MASAPTSIKATLAVMGLALVGGCSVWPETPPQRGAPQKPADEAPRQAAVPAEGSAESGQPAKQTTPKGKGKEPAPQGPQPNPYFQRHESVPAAIKERFAAIETLIEGERWGEAQAALKALGKDRPDLSGVYVHLGVVHQARGQWVSAEKAYEKAIERNRYNMEAHNRLAVLHRKRGRFQKAQATYQRALSIWPDFPAGHLNLGILYELYMGELKKAKAQYRKYLALAKAAAEGRYGQGNKGASRAPSIEVPRDKVQGWVMDLERRLKRKQTARSGDSDK